MNKREIIIICLILCFVLSLQAVAAADADINKNNNTNVQTGQDTSAVEVNNNDASYSLPDSNDKLQEGDGNAGSFSDLESKINTGGTEVTLDSNYTYKDTDPDSLSNGINIDHSVTIIGYGYQKNCRDYAYS